MPWKDAYTISDEKSLADEDLRWPEGKRCAVHIVVDLSVASCSEGVAARDIKSAPAEFGANQGLDLVEHADAFYSVVPHEHGAVFDDRQLTHFWPHAWPRGTSERD